MKKLLLTFVGWDDWDRAVYQDAEGTLYVDTDPRSGREPQMCTKYGNQFCGEPCDPVEADFIFTPSRAVWH